MAAADRTVPVPSNSSSQNGMDTKMTGTDGKEDSQTQSSVSSKRKQAALEDGQEEAREAQAQPNISKKKSSSSKPGARFTLRNPPWAYLHLELVTQPAPSSSRTSLDHLTARSYLTSALSQFLGVTGTSIPIDILKLETNSASYGTSCLWIRVPRDDLAAVAAALSSWIGGGSGAGTSNVAFRVRAKGNWLGALVGGKGEDLFL